MKNISFSIILSFLNIYVLQAQNLLTNGSLSIGFAALPQDRRLFDFPDYIIELEETRHDYEYSLLFSKAIARRKRWESHALGGYSLNHATFLRPFDHNYFTGSKTKEGRYVKDYFTYNINLGIAQRLNIAQNDRKSFYLQAPFLAKFAIRKHVVEHPSSKNKFNKWLFEPNNAELYLGLGCKVKKLDIGIAYRALNLQRIDPVIFNETLFDTRNPEFLEKKYEFRNLTKLWLTIAYSL